MEIKEDSFKYLEASVGYRLTLKADVSLLERRVCKAITLTGRSADDWKEIPLAEAEALQEQIAAAYKEQALREYDAYCQSVIEGTDEENDLGLKD